MNTKRGLGTARLRANTLMRLSAILLAACAVVATSLPAAAKNRYVSSKPGEVYFIRGLANVFSLGLDTLAEEYKKFGIRTYVYNHKHWEAIGSNIVKRHARSELSYPIILIGHSLGAGVAPRLASYLGARDIPVEYVVLFDPVEPVRVTNYVGTAVNYYIPHKGGINVLDAAPGFAGEYENVNVSNMGGMDHFNIEENEILRGKITARVMQLINEEQGLLDVGTPTVPIMGSMAGGGGSRR